MKSKFPGTNQGAVHRAPEPTCREGDSYQATTEAQ